LQQELIFHFDGRIARKLGERPSRQRRRSAYNLIFCQYREQLGAAPGKDRS
jgi:hypothetical protein